MQTNLTNQIKILRTAKGYSQEYLAEQTGLSLRTIQRIESGETEPRGDTLQRLAKVLEVDIAILTSATHVAVPQTSALTEDRIYLTLIHLSALSLIIFPLLGVLLPYILWTSKRKQIQGVEEIGKRVLNFQITWCIIFGLTYVLIISGFIFNFNIPIPVLFNLGGSESFLLIILFLYAYNIILTLVNSIMAYNSKKQFIKPALRLIK